MANGGDVRAGIPSYPDANVTRGFLPAALGFKEAGDTTEKKSWYDALVTVIAGYLGKEKSQEEIEEVAADLINENPEKAKEIVNQAVEEGAIPEGESPSFDDISTGNFEGMPPSTLAPKDTTTPIDTAKAPEGLPPSHPDFPGKTTTPYDVAKERILKQPELGHWLQDKSIGKFDSVQPNGGITEIKPEKKLGFLEALQNDLMKKGLDLNGDGIVDMKDLKFATQNGLEWAIPILKEALGMVDEKLEEWADPDKKKEVITKVPEDKIITKVPDKKFEHPIIEQERIKIKQKPDEPIIQDGGITRIPPKGAVDVTGTPTLTKKQLKKGAAIVSGEDPDKTKKKKDVPAWAIPLMSAGFSMMASKSPYFMQALGEAGEKGLETYATQKTAAEEKLDKKSERELREAQAEALKNKRGSIQLVGGKYFYKDGSPYMVQEGQNLVHATKTYTRAEIIEKLSTNMEFQMLMSKTNKTKEDMAKIESMITVTTKVFNSGAGGSTIDNATALEDEVKKDSWWNIVYDTIESWNPDEVKDGGIVSLRR
jgi:hypothetical protein